MLAIFGLALIVIISAVTRGMVKDSGRKPGRWVLAVIAIGLGFQYVVPITIGAIVGIVFAAQGKNAQQIIAILSGPAIVVNIICIFLSVIGMMLVLRGAIVLSTKQPAELPSPPPPPKFDGSDY